MADDDIDSQVLEKYEIVEKLGKGAYGIVWKVIQKKTKKVFALKKICNSFQNTIDSQRTYREIHFLHALHHDHIIGINGAYPSKNEKDLYLILEYMESDLHHVIRAKILRENHITYIAFQLLKALRYIHSGEIVHRDIKPSNILLNQKCHAKLADFGMARSLITDTDDPIILTEYVATRWYRAPEILFGSTEYTKACDMWAFGCVLAEMLTGKVLFPGSSTLNQIEKVLEFAAADEKKKNANDEQVSSFMFDLPLVKSILSSINVNKTKSLNSFFSTLDDSAIDLLRGLLQLDPEKRFTVDMTMKHKWFQDIREKVQDDGPVLANPIILPLNDNKKYQSSEYTNHVYDKLRDMRKLEYKDDNNIKETFKSMSRSFDSGNKEEEDEEKSFSQLKHQSSVSPQSFAYSGMSKQNTLYGKEKTGIGGASRQNSIFNPSATKTMKSTIGSIKK